MLKFDFPRQIRWKRLLWVVSSAPVVMLLGAAAYFSAQGAHRSAFGLLGTVAGYYLVTAWSWEFDLSTAFYCSGSVVERRSWIPFLNSKFDLSSSESYLYYSGYQMSSLWIFSGDDKLIASFPVGVFDFHPIEQWARENLRDREGFLPSRSYLPPNQ